MYELSKYLFVNFSEALFPHHCVCGKWGTVLCPSCEAKMVTTRTELCPCCKCISKYGKTCIHCRSKSNLTGVLIAGPHEGILKALIWKLKYGPIRDLSQPLAKVLLEQYNDFLMEKHPVMTFVPISRERRNFRGYNQAEEIAKYLAKSKDLQLLDLLKKPKDTIHQVGLSRKERLKNAVGSIAFTGEQAGDNKRVLIIDDVYTTGATLEECARVLRENGFREVWGMVLSRD